MVVRDQDEALRNSYKYVKLYVRQDQLEDTVDILARQDEDKSNNDDRRSLASILDSSSSVKKKGKGSNEKYLPCVSFNTVPRSCTKRCLSRMSYHVGYFTRLSHHYCVCVELYAFR